MNDTKPLEDPTNRIVSVFDNHDNAIAASRDLIERGLDEDQIRVHHGVELADEIDTSAKWFADTDEEIKRYARALRAGDTLLSVPVADSETRDQFHAVLKQYDARLITHFGEWGTEMMK